MFCFCFFRPSQATILQLLRLLTKEVAEATAAGAAEAARARAAKRVAARAELEGEEIKKLAEGASWRWGELADEVCRQRGTGWCRHATITEKEGGGMERKTNLILPSYVWFGGKQPNTPMCLRGKRLLRFCVCSG